MFQNVLLGIDIVSVWLFTSMRDEPGKPANHIGQQQGVRTMFL